MILLKIILWIFLSLLILILSIIFLAIVPRLKGRLIFNNQQLHFKGSFLFGLLKIYYSEKILFIKFLNFKVYQPKDKEKKNLDELTEEETTTEEDEKEEKKKKEKQEKSFKKPSLHLISLGLNLVKKIIRIIAPKYAYLKLKFGIDDPYFTGLTGLIYNTLFYPLNRVKRYEFIYEPVYNDVALEYEGDFYVNFSVLQLIIPVLRFILRKDVRDYLDFHPIKKLFSKKEKHVVIE
ncbi:MAG: hypothetical protein JXR88_08330 [Clostridia bacterium]|nr:hypothetical protein [Clostridia bacterium]